jgi:peptidoglycan/LPS O-acetylase OafA/YrhL
LGFEVWYYIVFGAFVFTPGLWRWPITIAAVIFVGPKVAILFPLWLMGVALYHLCSRPLKIKPSLGWILFVVPFLILVGYQLLPHPSEQPFTNLPFDRNRLWVVGQDYLIGSLFCMHIVGFTIVSSAFADGLERHSRTIRWIAGATFSLYLTHLPIMHFLAAISPLPKSSPWNVAFLITATPAAVFLFAEAFERRKDLWRSLITNGLRRLEVSFMR